MHRHGYKGRKFGRERDQREALIKSLADSLIKYESIETTLFKAKEIVPYVERLITKAKKGGLHNRRQIIGGLQTPASAHKLVDTIAPKLIERSSGHLRIKKTKLRRGDNAQMAQISFVDDLRAVPDALLVSENSKKPEKISASKTATTKTALKKPARQANAKGENQEKQL
jgi:large subunit ribosomal protein L17